MHFVDNRHARLGRTGRHGPDLLYRLAEQDRRVAEAALRAQVRRGPAAARPPLARRMELQWPITLRSPIRVSRPGRAS